MVGRVSFKGLYGLSLYTSRDCLCGHVQSAELHLFLIMQLILCQSCKPNLFLATSYFRILFPRKRVNNETDTKLKPQQSVLLSLCAHACCEFITLYRG